MAKINQHDVNQLEKLIGGRENIVSLIHCITRLRFALKDPAIADLKAIEKLKSVQAVITTGGQLQVVIGTSVAEFYQAFIQLTKLNDSTGNADSKEQLKQAARQNLSIFSRLIADLADIFFPLLPALIAGGMILGFRNILEGIEMIDGKTLVQVYPFWNTINSFLWLPGEAIFHFLPVGICWSAVKKMGGSPILGIVLGITLVSPQLMNSYGLASGSVAEIWDFGWFSIEKIGYQAQVIPSILAGLTLGFLETRLKKLTPDYLYLVIVPIVSLLVAVILAHTLIGPFGRMIGNGVALVVGKILVGDFAPIGSAIIGFLYAPLVITGVHQTSLAIDMQMVESIGGTPLWPLIALSNIAQGSAVLGIIIISRKENEREISVPAVISAYLGVTEPAMYGINLKYRFPMICAMIGSACAAFVCGSAGVLANSIGVGGLPGILAIQSSYWGIYIIAMLIAIVVPVLLTLFIYRYQQARNNLPI